MGMPTIKQVRAFTVRGGGADYRLSSRWGARADFEYQYWPQFTFGSMSSGGVTLGLRYLLLR